MVTSDESVEEHADLERSNSAEDTINMSEDEFQDSPPLASAQPAIDTHSLQETQPLSANQPLQSPQSTVLRSNIYNVPTKRKIPNKMEIATKTMTTVMLDHLKDMAMDAQEEARLQRFMYNERKLQESFITQIMGMQEHIRRENRECMMGYLDRLLPRMQGHEQPPYHVEAPYPMHNRGQQMVHPNSGSLINTTHHQPQMATHNLAYPPTTNNQEYPTSVHNTEYTASQPNQDYPTVGNEIMLWTI
ncbi:uncharacterized protein LOC142153819 [Mixophyes fleayi]|uniref:uncharacterized protein LOC142153819 n=1 Tax=Mixophyes fleayi TaxID=3061075 RepID=UPI003F4D957F